MYLWPGTQRGFHIIEEIPLAGQINIFDHISSVRGGIRGRGRRRGKGRTGEDDEGEVGR